LAIRSSAGMRQRGCASVLGALVLGSPRLTLPGACVELGGNAALLSASEMSVRARLAAGGGRLHRRRITGRRRGGIPGGVVASPDVQVDAEEEYTGKRWNLESPDGGSSKSLKWRKKKGGGTGAFIGAVLFVGLIGSMPVVLASFAHKLTKTQVLESVLLYMWLIGGLYLFTNVLIFQSPHFEQPRTLSMEESVYLYSQILTTVGYGDITPARPRGQLFIGVFVLVALLLIAGMIQELLEVFEELMETRIERLSKEATQYQTASVEKETRPVLREAFVPVIYSSLVFCCFVAFGTLFFSLYPGEGKTTAQAVYMSLITLSTVGFGAFTPSTHAGMVVGAFWMLFGTASLVAVVTSRAAFSMALKKHELATYADSEVDRGSSAGYSGSCHDICDKPA